MSNRKYGWWGYVKDIIRRYPELQREYAQLHIQSIIPQYSGMPGGGGDPHKVESVALRQLPGIKQREYDAMESALRLTRSLRDGAEREHFIDLVFWRQTHTLSGAAMRVHVSERTAQRWHAEFIKCVAGFYGFEIEKDENL